MKEFVHVQPDSDAVVQEPSFEVYLRLTADEIAALPSALDHVRVHMAHHYRWKVRDDAMTAIGKLAAAAKNVLDAK
jgi:hypothetical protein